MTLSYCGGKKHPIAFIFGTQYGHFCIYKEYEIWQLKRADC